MIRHHIHIIFIISFHLPLISPISYEFGPRPGVIRYVFEREVDTREDILTFSLTTWSASTEMIVLRVDSLSQEDHLYVSVTASGLVHLLYNMGSADHTITADQPRVDDGIPHLVKVNRSGASATLTVDNLHSYTLSPSGRQLAIFNSQALALVGGHKSKYNFQARTRNPFFGRVTDLVYDGVPLLRFAADSFPGVTLQGDVRRLGWDDDEEEGGNGPFPRDLNHQQVAPPPHPDNLVYAVARGKRCDGVDTTNKECAEYEMVGANPTGPDDLVIPHFIRHPHDKPSNSNNNDNDRDCDDDDTNCLESGSASGDSNNSNDDVDNSPGRGGGNDDDFYIATVHPLDARTIPTSPADDGLFITEAITEYSWPPPRTYAISTTTTTTIPPPSRTTPSVPADGRSYHEDGVVGSHPLIIIPQSTTNYYGEPNNRADNYDDDDYYVYGQVVTPPPPQLPTLIPLTSQPSSGGSGEVDVKSVALFSGVAVGALLLLLILLILIWKFCKQTEGSYKVDESKNYEFLATTQPPPSSTTTIQPSQRAAMMTMAPTTTMSTTDVHPQPGVSSVPHQQLNGGIGKIMKPKPNKAAVKRKDGKGVKEWYV